jgi:hypothetical protein
MPIQEGRIVSFFCTVASLKLLAPKRHIPNSARRITGRYWAPSGRRGVVIPNKKRPPSTDTQVYAGRIARQIDSLITSGAPPAHIKVIGTSKGVYIAQYVSTRLANPNLNFVFIGCYQKTNLQQFERY